MVILILIDFGVNFAVRMAKQIQLPAIDFLLKSLIFIALMPVLVIGVARSINGALNEAPDPLILMEEFSGQSAIKAKKRRIRPPRKSFGTSASAASFQPRQRAPISWALAQPWQLFC